MRKYVVLVTGGSGFLGQHVVKHLQLYGDNVKEIRVLDKVPYEQKLGIGFLIYKYEFKFEKFCEKLRLQLPQASMTVDDSGIHDVFTHAI